MRWFSGVLAFILSGAATAQEAVPYGTAEPPPVVGAPERWMLWHQPPMTPIAAMMDGFHGLLLWIMVAICVLVSALLLYVIVRFNARRNPTPSRTSHNTVIEVMWTVVPVVILVVIAIPSFRLLYFLDVAEEAEMTVEALGRQWYWDYAYHDAAPEGEPALAFSSIMIPEEDLGPGDLRLLEVDNRLVLPVDTTIRILVTGGDVLHSFAVPAFGLKSDAIPGRVNETWVRIEREGVYYGQCSEICGTGHAYMPIAVEAVSREAFAAWALEARERHAATSTRIAPTRIAQR